MSVWRNEEGNNPLSAWSEVLYLGGNALRIACQILGLFVIFWGISLGAQIFSDLWEKREDPERIAKLALPAETYLGEKFQIVIEGEKVPLGRIIALIFVLTYHVVLAWIALAIVAAGVRMIAWNFDERKQFRVILQELLNSQREEDKSS